jgi:hypothetical protein
MKHAPLVISILLACASLQAQAVGNLADVTIVDRDSGATLPVYSYRGEYWVAGRPGARYAVAVRNKLGERVLAVPSVDGVNVLSGETASWDQTGYVFSARERYQITGWRKSNSEVAAFEFSNASDSYAGRTGRPANVGVIGVALFREQAPEPVAQAPWYSRRDRAEAGAPAAPIVPAPAPMAEAASSGRLADRAAPSATAKAAPEQESANRVSPTAKLGTAHGQRETSVVSQTDFTRAQSRPNEVISIRYDSRENLIASGVIREPAIGGPVPRPFPDAAAASYVPDPPPHRY